MTGAVCITKFETMVDDEIDADLALQLVNDAKNLIESEVRPEITKKVSTSTSSVAGSTYTQSYNLPTDFLYPNDKIFVGTIVYNPIPFERQVEFRLIPRKFWVDLANSKYYLTGTQGAAETITFPYYYATTDLTTGTSPVWPTRFHSLIPLKMAQMYWAIDAGDRNRSWDDRYGAYYRELLNAFKDWDAQIKLMGNDNSTYVDETPPVDIGLL